MRHATCDMRFATAVLRANYPLQARSQQVTDNTILRSKIHPCCDSVHIECLPRSGLTMVAIYGIAKDVVTMDTGNLTHLWFPCVSFELPAHVVRN